MKFTILIMTFLVSSMTFAQSQSQSWMSDHLEYDPEQTIQEGTTTASSPNVVPRDSSPENLLGEKVQPDNTYHGQAEKAAVKIHSTKSKQFNRRVEEIENQGAAVNNN